jgi:hypothetical protein
MANSNLLTGHLPVVFQAPAAGPGAAREAEPLTENPWRKPSTRPPLGTPKPVDVETDEGLRVMAAIEDLPLEDAEPLPVVRLAIEHGYEGLASILDEALAQAQSGKGAQRHQQRAGQRFEDQPMQKISDLLDTNAGMAYQAIKKLTEACGQIDAGNREGGVRDLLGTIVYTAGIILRTRAKV